MPEAGNPEPQPQPIAAFNFRVQKTGDMIDLAGGRGPVISFGPHQHEKNINQIWSVFSVPGKNTILIKSEANQQWLVATGYCQPTSTGNPHWSDESAQWIIQGGNIHNLNNNTAVSIWNKQYADCVLDVEGGNGPGSPILAYKYHGGPNQIFRLWKRW